MVSRNDIVEYLVEEFYDHEAAKAAKATGYTKQQLDWWLTKKHQPRKANVSKLIFFAVVPKRPWNSPASCTTFMRPATGTRLRAGSC